MMPDASLWRSSAEYDYLDDLIASDLAWEYLRRNPDYQRDYARTFQAALDPQPAPLGFRRRWGLRFRGSTCRQRQDPNGVLDAGGGSGDGRSGALALGRRDHLGGVGGY